MIVNTEIFNVNQDIWEIVENVCVDTTDGFHETEFIVKKNGVEYQCCSGSRYETESGACYAILNEYRVEGEK